MSKYAPRIVNVDNQGTIALAENPIHYARTKHLDIQLQFVRSSIENETIKLQYCPTDTMLADIMTKALARDKHAEMRKLIGMRNTSASPVEDVRIGKLEEPEIDEWECRNDATLGSQDQGIGAKD